MRRLMTRWPVAANSVERMGKAGIDTDQDR
jgi:hypothetical protein